jgi:hypothetical protein
MSFCLERMGYMSGITTREGLQLELRREIALRDKALSGDLVLSVSPATLGSSAAAVNAAIGGAAAKFTRTVVIELQAANGDVHTWFDGTFAIAATKSSSGTVAIAGGISVATLVNGRAVVTLEYTGTWASADTQTLTVTGGTKLGYTVSNKTSVDTLVA